MNKIFEKIAIPIDDFIHLLMLAMLMIIISQLYMIQLDHEHLIHAVKTSITTTEQADTIKHIKIYNSDVEVLKFHRQ